MQSPKLSKSKMKKDQRPVYAVECITLTIKVTDEQGVAVPKTQAGFHIHGGPSIPLTDLDANGERTIRMHTTTIPCYVDIRNDDPLNSTGSFFYTSLQLPGILTDTAVVFLVKRCKAA